MKELFKPYFASAATLVLLFGGFLVPYQVLAQSDGRGACSSHGGVDCAAGADWDGSVICDDGWRDSTVSLLQVCESELSLMKRIEAIVQSSCTHELIQGRITSSSYPACVNEGTFDWYKKFDPTCREKMLLSNKGSCFCLGYLASGICLSDVFMNDVYGRYCGGPTLSTSAVLDIMKESIESGNWFFDTFIQLSCHETVDSRSIAINGWDSDQGGAGPAVAQTPTAPSSPATTDKPNFELAQRMKGRVLLQVQDAGRAWYVSDDGRRYYMKDGGAAYGMMRSFGLGITDSDLAKIPAVADSEGMKSSASVCATNEIANRLKGKILLQIQQHGEAWYVHPDKCRRIYLKDGAAAYAIMRFLSLGISNADIAGIATGAVGQ